MRKADFWDWFRLRRWLMEPWRFVRMRKKPIDTPTIEVPFRDGKSLTVRTTSLDRHILLNIYGRDEYRLNPFRPGELETVIDIGSHIGLFATRVARIAGRVLCYEPTPDNYRMLEQNVKAFPNVTPFNKAVSEKAGKATMYVDVDPGAYSMFPAKEERRGGPTEVECTTLPDIFRENNVERCDFLKLDCEGAEYAILYNAPSDFWPRIRHIRMEFHPVKDGKENWTGVKLAEFLRDVGYKVELKPQRRHPEKGLMFCARRT